MGSFAQGALIEQTTSITTTGGTTTLIVSSTTLQRFTGSSTQTVVLPNATTLLKGRYFIIENQADVDITINYYGGTFAAYIASGTERRFDLFNNVTSAGDWFIGTQQDLEGPLALHATRPTPNAYLNIANNQIFSGVGSLLSIAPVDDILNVFAHTTINLGTNGAATGGVSGGTVLTENGTFTRPVITSGQYVRFVFSYISVLNSINTKFSSASVLQANLTNPGILFASIEGMPVGYVDLKSLGSFNFSTANSTSAIVENKDIVKFAAGTGSGGGGDSSFKFQTISANILTVKKGYLILNDGREIYTPSDFTIDLTTVASVDGNYYGYIDIASLTTTPTYVNGRKVYQVTSSNFSFLTSTPDSYGFNLSRYIPIGTVQRTGGSWLNQQTTALRRHDTIVLGVDASLEFSQAYTTVGNVGDVSQIKAGHELDSNSFPSTIVTANVSWYGLTNANDTSTNGRNLTPNGAPVFTDTNIFGVANCFAPDGINDYLSSSSSFFGPSAATAFAFGLWIKADNYSAAGIQGLVSNFGTGNKSYKLQLNAGNLEFVTSSNGTLETTTFLYDATTLSGWNQIVVSYNPSGTLFSFYLNGSFLLSASLSIFSGTITFNLAAANNVTWFGGAIDEFFFITGNYLIQDNISKLYATKIVHNRNLVSTNQKWSGLVTYGDIEKDLFTNFTVDLTPNVLYADFSDQAAIVQIALKLANTGNIGLSKPVKSRTLKLTAAQLDALMPLTHYLYDVPFLRLQVDEGSGQYATHDDASYFTATTSQIISTGTTLTSVLGGSTVVRFTYSVGGESINTRLLGRFIIVGSVPDADFSDLWSALAAVSTVAGSRILVVSDQSTSIVRTISNTDIYIEFLPGVKINSTVSVGSTITFTGSGIKTRNFNLTQTHPSGTVLNAIYLNCNYGYHDAMEVVNSAAGSITYGFALASGASVNNFTGVTTQSAGLISNPMINSSGNTSNVYQIRYYP